MKQKKRNKKKEKVAAKINSNSYLVIFDKLMLDHKMIVTNQAISLSLTYNSSIMRLLRYNEYVSGVSTHTCTRVISIQDVHVLTKLDNIHDTIATCSTRDIVRNSFSEDINVFYTRKRQMHPMSLVFQNLYM